jgi:DNA-binding NtrC family response regulator
MEKVLVVDDGADILRAIRVSLKDSYEVLTAENAKDALIVFQNERPAIVITDIRMPGMSGIELMKQVKAIDSATQVIVISGHGDRETALEAVRLGAVDFLVKPIDTKRLKSAVKRALQKPEN